MSRQINQPINQVRLTNVAVVRMNKGGKRFEIACYRNKVVDWRAGLELDLSEVLQTDRVFSNVSKGEFAKAKDLQKIFGTKNEEEISKLILSKGQLQVSDKERNQQLEKTTAQIAEWISKNCVHPVSDRPYTISQIKHCMQQANFSVHPTKPLKRQYLDCVKLLQNVIPIQRAKMELLVVVSGRNQDAVEDVLKHNNVDFQPQQQQEETGTRTETTAVLKYPILVDPSLYKVLNEALETINDARLEIINQVVTKQGDVNLETETVDYNNNNAGTTTTTTSPLVDHQSSDVVDQLQAMKVSDDKDDDDDGDDDDTDGGSSEEGSHDHNNHDDEEELQIMDRRKAQKAAKKKNKKAKRRTVAETTNNEDNNHSNNDEATAVSPKDSSSSAVGAANNKNNNDDGRKSCNTCGGSFDTPAEFRSHFKSDWHRFNQKLKLKGCPPISEQEFLLCDAESLFTVDTGGL